MLDRRHQDTGAIAAAQGEMVRLAAAADEDDLAFADADEGGDFRTCGLDGAARGPARAMHRGWVAGERQRLRNRCGDGRTDRRCGIVIEIAQA